MAYFAELDVNNIVVNIHVLSNSSIEVDGVEIESKGVEFLTSQNGGGWYKQTSYNSAFCKAYAGVGYTYDPGKDKFIQSQPFPSWVLDSNDDWQPPVVYPLGETIYYWDESTLVWKMDDKKIK